MTKWITAIVGAVFAVLSTTSALCEPIISTGSDGPFSPSGGIVTLDLPQDGIFNFTTIHIPAGTIVKFNRNQANTPVYFAATENVTIEGEIHVSAASTDTLLPPVAENPKQNSGPGGFNGGFGGTGSAAIGVDGNGPGAGGGGYSAGGAGNAAPGNQAVKYSSTAGKGDAGPFVDYPYVLAGGSGGGGGSAAYWFGWYSGGYGGGGGGSIQISTPGTLTINGKIIGNGANAGWASASALANGGAGGGGSGGNVELFADQIILDPEGSIQVLGGYGGGLSIQPYSLNPAYYSSEADGGMGYVSLKANQLWLDGTIDGIQIEFPAAFADFAGAYGSLVFDDSYGSLCDTDKDGDIDGYDLSKYAQINGQWRALTRPAEF